MARHATTTDVPAGTDKLEFPATVIVEIDPPSDEHSLWYATSRMMRGLLVVGRSREECVAKIPGALSDFTQVCREYDPAETRQ